jgi:hypothetical protein
LPKDGRLLYLVTEAVDSGRKVDVQDTEHRNFNLGQLAEYDMRTTGIIVMQATLIAALNPRIVTDAVLPRDGHPLFSRSVKNDSRYTP